MKKKIIGAAFIIIFSFAACWNIYNNKQSNLYNDLSLGNIEALASGESDCPNGCYARSGHCWCNGYHPYYEAG